MRLAFGMDVENHNRLLRRLNNISFSMDTSAPVEILTEAEEQAFEKHNSTRGFRCDIVAEPDKREIEPSKQFSETSQSPEPTTT